MKKLLALSLLLAAPLINAEPLDVQMKCSNGGTRTLKGSYIPITGKFSTETTLNNCINKRNVTSNGKVNASGTFKITTGSQAQLDATLQTDVSRSSDKKSTQQKCERNLSGTYDLATNKLDGTESSTCEKSGQMYSPILELVAGLSESEALENLEALTLENLQSLDKEEVKGLIKTLLEGNELSRDRRRPARFAQALVNGLTATQKQATGSSSLAACSDLNYPGMWEYLGLCK